MSNKNETNDKKQMEEYTIVMLGTGESSFGFEKFIIFVGGVGKTSVCKIIKNYAYF